jgi:O-antigen ligase
VLDRFTPISPLTLIFPEVPNDPFGAQGTYPHRILYGYAMAMGVPVAMSLLDGSGSKRTKRLLWLGICLMAATCYFSTSRGPWLGLAIALCIMCAMGGKSQRRRCKGIAVLVVAVMIIRPGVWQTIADKYEATFDTNSHKGKSYEYRYRLWHVAISEIGKTPERTLFGHGGLSTETMDLSQYFEKQSGGTTHKLGYTSWDNRYACDLMEFGVVGFALLVWLFGYISIRLGKVWWKGCEAGQAKRAGILAAAFVFVFAQTNVDIFSEQLKFLFWGLTAMGFALGTDLSKVSRRARMPKDVLISAVEPAVR